jgi:hypothetical protein
LSSNHAWHQLIGLFSLALSTISLALVGLHNLRQTLTGLPTRSRLRRLVLDKLEVVVSTVCQQTMIVFAVVGGKVYEPTTHFPRAF